VEQAAFDGITTQVAIRPQITICTDIDGPKKPFPNICDWPDCPKVAVHVVGVVAALRVRAAMCAEHAARFANRGIDDSRPAL
jgi:hypothetical protein